MGEMRDSDWSRRNLLRSDWSGPSVAIMTTNLLFSVKMKSADVSKESRLTKLVFIANDR